MRHWTEKGKVVYERKPHFFGWGDWARVTRACLDAPLLPEDLDKIATLVVDFLRYYIQKRLDYASFPYLGLVQQAIDLAQVLKMILDWAVRSLGELYQKIVDAIEAILHLSKAK